MKIRTNHVSNSSSSSFVIPKPKDNKLNMCLEIDVSDYINYTIKNEDELYLYFVEELGLYENEFLNENGYWNKYYEEMLKEIQNGQTLIQIDTTYSKGDRIQKFLYSFQSHDKLDYIFSDKILMLN